MTCREYINVLYAISKRPILDSELLAMGKHVRDCETCSMWAVFVSEVLFPVTPEIEKETESLRRQYVAAKLSGDPEL